MQARRSEALTRRAHSPRSSAIALPVFPASMVSTCAGQSSASTSRRTARSTRRARSPGGGTRQRRPWADGTYDTSTILKVLREREKEREREREREREKK